MMSKNKPAAFYNLKFYIVKTRVLLLLGSFEEKKAVLLPGLRKGEKNKTAFISSLTVRRGEEEKFSLVLDSFMFTTPAACQLISRALEQQHLHSLRSAPSLQDFYFLLNHIRD